MFYHNLFYDKQTPNRIVYRDFRTQVLLSFFVKIIIYTK